MNRIKRILKISIVLVSVFFMPCAFNSYNETLENTNEQIVARQWYSFSMKLSVPRIYNNNESLGQRKYQTQTIKGRLSFDFDKEGHLIGMSFIDLYNSTHILSNGKHVTYDGYLDHSKTLKIVAIGNNKTKKFNTASICFSMMAEPSYNIGEFDEDTSLFVTLAGKGQIKNGKVKRANGTVSGTLGCGCYAYGHISPTRMIWQYGVSDIVTDIAAVHGTWRISAVK